MNTTCFHCGQVLDSTLSFCEHCGTKNANEQECECETHADRNAVGMCVVCYKPVCDECKSTNEHKIFCSERAHQEIFHQWNAVYRTDSEFEADAIRQNLKAAEIESKMFSLYDHIAMHFLPLNRTTVWVKQHERGEALSILTDLNLIAQIHQT